MLEFNTTFAEMRDLWIRGFRDRDFSFLSAHNARVFRDQASGYSSYFYGASGGQMLEWFREGYTVPTLDDIGAEAAPVRKRARPKYNDCEGDFRYDLFMTGDENHFVQWSQRESIPGITVEFHTGFLADINASVIAEYVAWICSALIAIEASGIDAAIYATATGVRRFNNSSESLKWRCEVKREGERNDFQTWSALFSPGSYRILGFFTNILAAERLGKRVNEGMGASSSKGWGVNWNAETRTLEITHVSKGYGVTFPADLMTEQLKNALESAKGN